MYTLKTVHDPVSLNRVLQKQKLRIMDNSGRIKNPTYTINSRSDEFETLGFSRKLYYCSLNIYVMRTVFSILSFEFQIMETRKCIYEKLS